MRRGIIFKHEKLAGELCETATGSHIFSYDSAWRARENEWLSLTMPYELHNIPTETRNIPAFLEGLIPEGWLLDIAYKLKPDFAKDRFGLLLAIAKDCVGSVSVLPDHQVSDVDELSHDASHDELSPTTRSQPDNPYGRCLVCMEKITGGSQFYHDNCARQLFEGDELPDFPYVQEQFDDLARQNIRARLIIPGVQRKISASIARGDGIRSRITIAATGEHGLYVIKPEHPLVPTFPANEHLAMSLARAAGIPTADFGLIVGKDGKLAYITRRFDRKLHQGRLQKRSVEDFGQLFGRIRDNDKYRESYDKIGKYLNERSLNPLVDVVRFFDQVFLCYLIGNNDFHLRNLSVFTDNNTPTLTPAYDMTITQLIDFEPDEDTTLPVNGKKNHLRYNDWLEFAVRIGLNKKAFSSRMERFEKLMVKFAAEIDKSLIPDDQKQKLAKFMVLRMKRVQA